ncbi:MAG: hypothetical protein KKA42_04875, partial [candidate division Zixibacteria bacterium]|nr:hypothetical protein [candidate division Zixibacteria bacterium]
MCRKILFIRFGSLGDVILTSPIVLNVRINFPQAEILFLTKERFRPVVQSFGEVDRIVALPDHASLTQVMAIIDSLDGEGIDTIVDLHGNFRSWLIRTTVTANARAHYPKRRIERIPWIARRRRTQEYPHTVDLYNDTLRQMDRAAYADRPVLHFSTLSEDWRERIPQDCPVVVVGPGAAHPNKQWPVERFAEVARRLHEEHGAVILWTVMQADAGKSGLEGEFPPGHFHELADLDFASLRDVFARADVALTNDSGLGHLASAVGTPVLTVFGPTHPYLGFAPRGLFDRVLEVDEPCRPCSRHGKTPCHREERFCFTRISAERAFAQLSDMLQVVHSRQPALFVDRDGTIMGNRHYLSDPDGVVLLDGAVEGLLRAAAKGYRLVMVSNQSGVARGFFDI